MLQAFYQANETSKVVTLTNSDEIHVAFHKAAGQTDPHCKVWITLEAANEDELNWLSQSLKLHSLVIEDILHRNQRSKIDEYDTYLFLVLHRPLEETNKEIEWEELHIILGNHWLV